MQAQMHMGLGRACESGLGHWSQASHYGRWDTEAAAAGGPEAILTTWGDCRFIAITVRLILLSSLSMISCMCMAVGPWGDRQAHPF